MLFSFFFLSYDPVLWPLVGNHYMVSTFLVLFSFLSLVRYRRTGANRHLWGFMLCYAFSIYTHEISVPLIGVCVFYDLTHIGKTESSRISERLLSLSRAYIVPAAALALLWGIKHFLTMGIVVSRNTPLKLLQNFGSAACFLSPFNNMNAYWLFSRWGENPVFLVIISSALAIGLVLCFAVCDRKLRVMLVWSCAFLLPAVLVAQPGPRYFYIPAIGWSIFLAGIIQKIAARIGRGYLFAEKISSPHLNAFLGLFAALLLYGCITLQGYRHAAHLLDVWIEGSSIMRKTVASTAGIIGYHPDIKRVVVVDQPRWYQADGFYGAPLLTGPMDLSLSALLDFDSPKITTIRLRGTSFFDQAFRGVSREWLEEAAAEPGTLVIQYDPAEQRMVLYEPAPE